MNNIQTSKISHKTGKFHALLALMLIGLLLLAQQPDLVGVSQALAGWNATNLSTATYDAQGLAQTGNANVNDIAAYDTTKDPSPSDQIETGIDPNWKNGITKTTGPLELDGQQTHTSHSSLLGSTAVNDSYLYDRTKDSSPDVQAKLGIDPNWYNGVSRKSYALSFDGSSQYVTLPNDIYDTHTQGTISAWIYPTDITNEVIFGEASSSNAGALLYFRVNSGKLNFNANGNADSLNGDTTMTANSWYHVVATSNGSTINLYVNGVAQTISILTGSNTGKWFISSAEGTTQYSFGVLQRSTGNIAYFNGNIDEVAIYNRAISADEVSGLYNSRRVIPDSSTVGLWHFDEGADNSCRGGVNDVCDASGGGNDGAASGGPTWVTGGQAIMDNATRPIASGTVSDDASYEIKGAHNYSLNFNGTDEYVNYGAVAGLSGLSNMTIEAWVYTDTVDGSGQMIVANAKVGSGWQFSLEINNSNQYSIWFRDGVDSGHQDTATSSNTVQTGVWTHLAGVRNASTGKVELYINGIKNATGDINYGLSSTNDSLGFGARYNGQYPYDGQVDEVRISNVARYTGNFTPKHHYNDDSNTIVLMHVDEGTGSSNTYDDNESGRTAADGTLNSMDSTNWVNLDNTIPDSNKIGQALYRWREPAGTWSETRVTSGTARELKEAGTAEGVYIKWPSEDTRFGPEDQMSIASWFIEAASASLRSATQAFPEKTAIYATNSGLDIIDLSDNTLWIRFAEGASNALPSSTFSSLFSLNSLITLSAETGLFELNFNNSTIKQYLSTGTATYASKIADRADGSGYGAAAGTALIDTVSNSVHATVINTATGYEQIAAVATDTGVTVINNETGNSVAYDYSDVTNDDYNDVWITGGGEVYANNEATSTLERWDNVDADSADEANGTPDRTYDEASSPPIAQAAPTINDIFVSEKTSSALAGQNTIFVATNTDAVRIDEHTTQSSGTVKHYEREGTLGSSGWTQAAFKGAVHLGGTDEYVTAADSVSLSVTGDLTLEAWVNFAAVGAARTIISKWDITTGSEKKSYRLYVTASNQLAMDISGATDGTKTEDTGSLTTAGTWYHVAGVYNATSQTITLYVNGTSVASTATGTIPAAITDSDQALMIGAHTGTVAITGFLNGKVDEARVTAAQAYTANFTVPNAAFSTDPVPGNTKALWHFDATTGTSAVDSSGNANTGTLTAGAQFVRPVIKGTADIITGVASGITSSGGSSPSLSSSTLFTSSDGAGADDGSLTKISLTDDLRQDYWDTTTTPAITDSDVNTVSTSPKFGDPSVIYGADAGAGSFSYASPSSPTSYLLPATSSLGLHPNSSVDNDKAYEVKVTNSGKPGTTTPPPTYQWREAGGTYSADVEIPNKKAKFGNSLYYDGGDSATSTISWVPSTGTIEFWIKTPAAWTSYGSFNIIRIQNSGDDFINISRYHPSNNVQMQIYKDSAYEVNTGSAQSFTANSWHHIALTFTTNSTILWIDGVSAISNTSCNMITDKLTTAYLGYSGFPGWIDEIRLSNSVRYSSTFSLQKTPFEPDTNTLGLWHMDGSTTSNDSGTYGIDTTTNNDHRQAESNWQTVVDSSKYHNNGTLGATTAVGTDDPTWSSGYQRLPAGGKFGGAGDFDATDDFAVVADAASLDIADDLTLEAWVQPDNSPAADEYIAYRANSYYLKIDADDHLVGGIWKPSNSTWVTATSAGTITVDGTTWTHVALTFDNDAGSNEVKAWLNGTQDGVGTLTEDITATAYKFYIGAGDETHKADSPENWFDGALDDVRLSNKVLYSANFTAPSTPSLPSNSSIILLHLDEGSGQYAFDSSTNANTATFGAAATAGTDDPLWVSTGPNIALAWNGQTYYKAGDVFQINSWAVEQPTTGSVSMASASSQFVSIGDVDDVTTGDFTVEAWVKPTDLDVGNDTIIDKLNAAVGTNPGFSLREDTSGKITAVIEDNGGDNYSITTDAVVLTAGQWTHVAAVYDRDSAGATGIYINGVKVAQTATGTYSATVGSLTNAVTLRLGAGDNAAAAQEFWNGEIDEVRLSSVTRYFSNLTPPIDLTYDSATSGLWKFNEQQSLGAATAPDTSGNNNDGTLQSGAALTSNGTRGVRRGFPNKSYLLATDGGVDIIDATDNSYGIGHSSSETSLDLTAMPSWHTNRVWMKLTEGANNALPSSTFDSIGVMGGIGVIGADAGLIKLDFANDSIKQFSSTGTALYASNFADRNDGSTYGAASGTAINNSDANGVSLTVVRDLDGANTIAGRRIAQMVAAVGTANSMSVIQEFTGTTVAYDYSNVTDDPYGAVWLTSEGDLFAANTDGTNKGFEMWNDVHRDAADELNGTPDLALTTLTTPSIPSSVISDIAVSEYTSATDYGRSPTVYVATDSGTAKLDLSTDYFLLSTSSTILNRGSGGWISKTFGAVGRFDGTDDKVALGAVYNGVKTVEFWLKPNDTTESILELGGTKSISVAAGTIAATNFTTPNIFVDGVDTDTLPDANWHHIAVVTDTGVDASAANVGLVGAVYYTGILDEIRFSSTNRYSAAFQKPSAPFVADSNTVGLWHFGALFKHQNDLCTNTTTTVCDSSSYIYNGTWSGVTAGYGTVLPSLAGSSAATSAIAMLPFDYSATTPSILSPSLSSLSSITLATNGAGANDGAVTILDKIGNQQYAFYGTNALADLDVSSVAMLSAGDIMVGTDATSATRLRNRKLDTTDYAIRAQRQMKHGKSVIRGIKSKLNQ